MTTTRPVILAIDQGTTSSKALLIDSSGAVRAAGTCTLAISAPRPGWVEQDAGELWSSVVEAVGRAVAKVPGVVVAGVAISNQRETVVAWDHRTGEPVAPAISWQDQRGDEECRALATAANTELVRRLSGLDLGSMYSASKIAWFQRQYEGLQSLRLGTVDAWLVDRLTDGAVYACEAGNASRTLLLDIERLAWSPELASVFGVDLSGLPEVWPSVGPWGTTRGLPGVPDGTPIVAVLGDSHAALYGHWASAPDAAEIGKATYGTGSSVMVPVEGPRLRVPGLGTTLAWQAPDPCWALEGNILYSGAGMDWLARTLGVSPGAEFSALAATATHSRGAVFVPALNGLGAPWWSATAVGTITGLDSATTRAEIALAGIEAVAHQVCDVVDAMDPDRRHDTLHVGGGASASDLLMQRQADLLGRRLLVSGIADISALGVAALGFEALGVAFEPSRDLTPREILPTPGFTDDDRGRARRSWRDALHRAGVATAASPVKS